MTRLRQWGLAGLNAFTQGGALAVKPYVCLATGNAMANELGVNIPTLHLKQAACVFIGGGLYHFVDYLLKNPLPIVLTTSAAQPQQPQGNP